MLSLILAVFLSATSASAAPMGALPFEIYLYGEKPGLAEPVKIPPGNAIRIHLARDGFATLAIRFPAERAALVPLDNVSLKDAKFSGGPSTLAAYALGVQVIEKSSFSNGPPRVAEVADLVLPNEWLSKPGFHIPERRIPARPQYLFEIHAPENAGTGDFQAKIHFEREGKEFDIPVQLRIHKLKLPKRFKLRTSFGFAPYGALIKHFGKWADKEQEVHQAYARLAGEHRVDLHKFYISFPKAGKPDSGADLLGGGKTSFTKLWQLTRSPQLTKYGFTASTTDLPIPEEEKKAPTEGFWKAMQSSVIQNNLLDDSFVYYVDEPEAKTYPQIRDQMKKIRAWAPQMTFLGTVAYRKDLEGTFNLWCPNLIHWDHPGFARPSEYLERRSKYGEHFWVYTSCSAHGCGPAAEANLADLVTDRPAAYHRAFAWAAFDADAEGILYYNTVEGYGAGDLAPWRDPFLFHGNGEGNLFYPCTMRFCGIDGVNVVPSLRWKSIRDGLEDVEIFEAGLKAGLPVRDWAKAAYKGVTNFSKSTADYEKVRVRVLEALDGPVADRKK